MAASDTDKPGTGDVVHSDVELRETVPASVPIVDDDEEDRVTPKAMFCIFLLALTYGVPFWAAPTTAAISSQLLTRFGSTEEYAWVIPVFTVTSCITSLLTNGLSDLFGRRMFLIAANVIVAAGYALSAAAKNTQMLLGGITLVGIGYGVSGIALFAVPELVPNKYRHIGVVLADLFVYVIIVIGPVAGRYAILSSGESWRFLYWGGFIGSVLCFFGLLFFYFPPKHPRGVEWRDALRSLDYVGAFLFAAGGTLALAIVAGLQDEEKTADLPLVGIVYTSYLPSKDPKVVACLVVGFATIVAFALWEQFACPRFPLCPRDIFASHHGREFAVPFVLSFIICSFFWSNSIIYPTMLNNFYIDADTPTSTQLLLTLPSNLGLPFGALMLTLFGSKVGHWKWSLFVSTFSLVLWGCLLALITPYNKAMMISFVTLGQVSYGWAAYVAVSYSQLGVPQIMLGVSGGLAATARFAGGAIGSGVYTSAIANGILTRSKTLIPAAVRANGLPDSMIPAAMEAAGSGAAAVAAIPGMTAAAVGDIVAAYRWSVAYGLRNCAMVSLAFGVVGVVLVLFTEDISPKMTPKIETFLENDELAEKNKFH